MRLPKDLLSGTYRKPNVYLCEVDKTKICMLEPIAMSGSFKFNTYSELSFTIGRTYTNMITGETQVNPFYEKIQALRLILVEGFGYFEIQDPEIVSDGIREVKNITAYSLEYTLSQKYLENFKINTGEVDSIEVLYANEHGTTLVPVSLYNIGNPDLSLLDLALEKIYGWKIGHVDESLKTMTRTFEIPRASVYDFIVQDICENFNCFAVFDTINNIINLYSEALITKHLGDGTTKTFKVPSAYSTLSSVSVNGYRTTKYEYNIETTKDNTKVGHVTFNDDAIPSKGAKIEITDGSQDKWQTDVYVTFQNLAQEVNVSYSADDIKTVLTVKGADELDIREVNMGLPYLVDISYYYNVDWMGQELFDKYTEYVEKTNKYQDEYTDNAQRILELNNKLSFLENRVSLGYGIDHSVNSKTVGTYYVIDGGSYPDYTYKEVSLPSDYNANTTYYKLNGVNVTEDKVHTLYSAIRKYFIDIHQETEPEIKDIATRKETWQELLEDLTEQFEFVESAFAELKAALTPEASVETSSNAYRKFLDLILGELGRTPLQDLFLKPYEEIKKANDEYKEEDSGHYWFYYPVNIIIDSLNAAIANLSAEIELLEKERDDKYDVNADITEQMSIYNHFTPSQLIRLSSFLREDEYTDDNFVETSIDTIGTLIQTKNELRECGKIELSKLCEPRLAFSMDMANIYALPEFEPIIDQFQLGKLINVAIRDDYVKRARLLAVDINFDDFSDFTCEFGELTNLKTQSSIHADLLASALSAGKTVASNASYWNKGADVATSTDIKIQQGLLSAIGGLYTSDQSVTIDDKGILLRQVNENGGFSPYQAWLKNNTILLSDDSFKTARTGLGEFEAGGQTFYGILAEAMLSGYIEGSKIVGGTINIGEGTFVVDEKGHVKMNAASIAGYVEENNVISSINQSPEEVAINANRISLTGKKIDLTSDNITINSTNFSVTEDGHITATSGEIGGWDIGTNDISGESGAYKAMISKAAIGTSGNAVFGVYDGSSWSCYMDGVGKLYASNAEINGKITATSGKIGSWTIGDMEDYTESIYSTYCDALAPSGLDPEYVVFMRGAGDAETDIAIGVKKRTSSSTTWGNAETPFYVRKNGHVCMTDAYVVGTIHSQKGTIGGWTIDSHKIYGTSEAGNVAVMQLPSDGTTFVFAAGGTRHDSYADCPFRVTKYGKLYATDAEVSGTINATAGVIGGCTISNGELKIHAANITAGTINVGHIPDLSAEKITAGVIHADRIPNISADKITSGTISTSRLSSSVITTGNFSSKTLSTGNLSVTNGGNIGIWTVNSNNYLYAISGNYGVSLSATSVSHGQGGSATWVNIVKAGQNASDERLKTNIVEFDDKFDNIFDTLKPVKFEYSKDFLGKGTHFGYIAQDVVKSFENEGESIDNYSFIYQSEIEDDSDEQYYQLNKSDFIALNTWQIQKLKARIEELENKLGALEGNDTK